MSKNEPVVIKRVKKGGHAAHHGGAWKVAYADFVTAMMAFFLLLWLLNASTEQQLSGLADYFSPTVASISEGGAGGVMGGRSMLSPGSAETPSSASEIQVSLMPLEEADQPDYEGEPAKKPEGVTDTTATDSPSLDEELLRQLEQKEFDRAEAKLRDAIASTPDLREFSKNLLVDMTPEGMRIQIADAEERSMFPSGSSEMYPYTKQLLSKIVQVIAALPNDVAVIGHTDASQYHADNGYSNWELSTDRANASRRTLVDAGFPEWRIVRVVGKADQEPLLVDDPYSPQNRRISVLLLRSSGIPRAN